MKANEAPEKIYLPYKDDRLIGLVKTEGVKFNSGVDGHIEYIRKDAFIEKACYAYCNTCGNSRCSGIGCAKLITFKERLNNRL